MALSCRFTPISAPVQLQNHATTSAQNATPCLRKLQGLQIKSSSSSAFNTNQNFLPRTKPWIADRGKRYIKTGPNVISSKTSLDTTQEILEAYDDEYSGVIIDAECLPTDPSTFVALLRSSLFHWRFEGKKGVWLKLFTDQADLVPLAIKEGFRYHHAEEGYVMLTYWLPEEAYSLPATGSHQVGMGGFVINENKEVLVVKEKICPSRCNGVWKLPTGFIDKSEEIFLGAIREIKEETGHAHKCYFEKSDLFYICMLKPLSFKIKIDEFEIEEAKWMPLHDFIAQSFIKRISCPKKQLTFVFQDMRGATWVLQLIQLYQNLMKDCRIFIIRIRYKVVQKRFDVFQL